MNNNLNSSTALTLDLMKGQDNKTPQLFHLNKHFRFIKIRDK